MIRRLRATDPAAAKDILDRIGKERRASANPEVEARIRALVEKHGDKGALEVMQRDLQARRQEMEERSREIGKLRHSEGRRWILFVVAVAIGLTFAYLLWKLSPP